MDIEVLGIDQGKAVRSLAGLDASGCVSQAPSATPSVGLLERLQPCVVAMEACGGTHHSRLHARLMRLQNPDDRISTTKTLNLPGRA